MPQRVEAATYTYDNTSSGAISNTTTSCASPLVRTFTVGDNFTVQDVNLGFNADHAYRGDIQVTLRHPDGTSVQVMASNGSDGSAGYDVLLDSSSANALNDGNADNTAIPLYERTAAPSNSLSAFNGKASNGTWTLEICDTFSSDDGTFNSAQLILDDTAPPIDPSLPTGERPFSLRYSVETTGNIEATGNAVLTCDTGSAACTSALSAGTAGNNNGGLAMQMLDVDSDGSTFNSSASQLTIPAGANVLFAGLYWGGTSDGATTAAPDASKRNEALLSTPSSGYQTITADTFTSMDNSGTTGWDVYNSFADVTSLVQGAGSGTYTMANVQTSTGTGFTYPNAGWSLVVVYEDPTEPRRNLTVFDGYQFTGFGASITNTLSGLRTPPTTGFDVFMGAVAGDGEVDQTGDHLAINGTRVTDALNPSDNFFNGTISKFGSHITARTPNDPFNLVIDIDYLDLTSWNQANNAIPTNATSIDVTLGTDGDGIWPMAYFFGVEVFEPNLVTQFEKTTPLTSYATGDIIPYTISVTNTGNDNSVNTVITDAIPTGTTFVPGSLIINGVTKTDGAGDDEAEFDGSNVVFRVGTGANASQGGQININDSVTMTFDVTVSALPGEQICNQATIDYEGQTSGNTASGVSDNPNTVALNDCTETTTSSPSGFLISGQVLNDSDSDGDLNDADTGISGVTVILYDDPDGDGDPTGSSQIDTTTTNGSGNYIFVGLTAGDYIVTETDPVGFTSTNDSDGFNNNRIAVNLVASDSTGNNFLDASVVTSPTPQACGTTFDFTWGAGGAVWNVGDTSNTYTNVNGSGIDVTVDFLDPNDQNIDFGNPGTNNTYTQSDGAFGLGYLTWAMTAQNANQTTSFVFSFSRPILVDDLQVVDIDGVGYGFQPTVEPGDSFQDEVTATAELNGVNVPVSVTPDAAGTMTIVDQTARGRYPVGASGNLSPTDPQGQMVIATIAPVDQLRLDYSNGPDDARAVPNGDGIGVSDDQAVAIDQVFRFCEAPTRTISGQVREDVDNDGDLNDTDSGLESVTVELFSDPNADGDASDGTLIATQTTDASGNFTFTNVETGSYVIIETNPGGYTSTADSVDGNDDQIPVSVSTTDSTGNVFLDYAPPVATDPDVLLVKRITAINGDRTENPNDNTSLNAVVNDSVADSADDHANWPASYLLGELDAGLVKPGDEIEYTVYFLNGGGSDAEDVRICDWIQPNQSFVTGIYGESVLGARDGNDIELDIGGSTYQLTAASDVATVDRGELAIVVSLPAGPTCNLPAGTNNNDNVLVLDITGTTGDPTGLTTFPGTTGQGTPNNAFGFFRFTTKVDE